MFPFLIYIISDKIEINSNFREKGIVFEIMFEYHEMKVS